MKGFYWETDESVNMETILYYIVSNFSEENTLWSLSGLDRLEQYYAKLNDRIFNREQMMENIHMIGETVSITLKAYHQNEYSASLPFEKNDYPQKNQFLQSPCLVAYYCYDCYYHEIYIKEDTKCNSLAWFLESLPLLTLKTI